MRGWTFAAVLTVLAAPAHAVRLCHNVCTCNASCSLTCRDDNFVPTTCGASPYDCIDKCLERSAPALPAAAVSTAPAQQPLFERCETPAAPAPVQARR